MTRGPDPEHVAGLLTVAEATQAEAAVADLRGRDADRFDAAVEAFADED